MRRFLHRYDAGQIIVAAMVCSVYLACAVALGLILQGFVEVH